MNTTPATTYASDQLKFGFGRRLLKRRSAIRVKEFELEAQKHALANDVQAAGVQGLLSLTLAILEQGPCLKFELLAAAEECAPGITPAVDELLELFAGNDGTLDLWHVSEGGSYGLNLAQ